MERECTTCGTPMDSGFVIEDGEAYFCSEPCLEAKMTKEEYLALHNEGEGDSYWTTWEKQEPVAV